MNYTVRDSRELGRSPLQCGRYLTYLCCPYTTPSIAERNARADHATKAAAFLIMDRGWNVFSPITHSHPMHAMGLNGDWDFWSVIDKQYLQMSQRVVVLCLDGWRESKGVCAEIEYAQFLGLPIHYMTGKKPEAYMLSDVPPGMHD